MIEIDAGFPGGAVEDVSWESDNVVWFAAPLKGSPQAMWFYFRVRNAKGRPLTFRLKNPQQILGGKMANVLPVVREAVPAHSDWQRLTRDQITWDGQTKSFSFSYQPLSDETYFAFCYPYVMTDLHNFLSTIDSKAFVQLTNIGVTRSDKNIPIIQVGEPTDERRIMVAVTARHHAGETPGSYVLEGIIQGALRDDEFGDWCRKHVCLLLFPMVDLDGVEEGRYGKNRPPLDMNRDWSANPQNAEVQAIRLAIQHYAKRHDYKLFFDLHAPEPDGRSYMVPTRQSHLGPDGWRSIWHFASLLAAEAPAECPIRVEDYPVRSLNWAHSDYEQMAAISQCLEHGVVAATLENTYHRHCNGGYVDPTGWRKVGSAWTRSMVRWLRDGANAGVIVSLPPPTADIPGWHEVHLLRNVTITSDAQSVTMEPTEAANSAWIAMDRFMPVNDGKIAVTLRITNDCSQAVTVQTTAFFFIGSIRNGCWDLHTLFVPPGTSEQTVMFQSTAKADTCRIGLKVAGLDGRFGVRVG